MRKHFLLAIPLASMLLFAGCASYNTCGAPVDDCNTCGDAPVAYANADAVYTASAPAAVVHGVENAVYSAGHAVGLASAGNSNIETLTPEAYAALIASGKVTDAGYRAPGSDIATVESASPVIAASVPSRIEPIAASARVSVEVDAVAAPSLASAMKSSVTEESEEGSVAATEMPITSDELVTPAMLNAAALREANIVSATVAATGVDPISGSGGMPRIPSMPLPEGWDYIDLDEHGLGANTVENYSSDDQYFSSAGRFAVGGGSDDI